MRTIESASTSRAGECHEIDLTQGKQSAENVYDLFVQQALRTPHRVAIAGDDGIVTYEKLQERVQVISGQLSLLGVRRKSIVALSVAHGSDLIAAVFAVLRLGAAYLPIDIRNPADRVSRILENSEADLLLYSRSHADRLKSATTKSLCIDAISGDAEGGAEGAAAIAGDDTAYIIYTSGSSGQPKGVLVTHANLLHYTKFAIERYIDSSSTRVALYSTLAFDFTVTCIFPPLLVGASVSVFDGISDPLVIKKIVRDRSIDVVKITPAYLQVLEAYADSRVSIKRLIVGGEDLKTKVAREITTKLPAVEIINEYGPTEATVGCMVHRYDPRVDIGVSVPIGVPIPGVSIALLSDELVPVAAGEIGEIYISGPSVAAGYLKQPEKTRDAFISDPRAESSIFYKTGDFAYKNREGLLIYVGREDGQLKINGNRVELEEVESALLKCRGVRSVYLTVSQDGGGNAILVTALICDEGSSLDAIRKALREMVPDYMIPSRMVLVSDFPLTENQKVCRRSVLELFNKEMK
ncbi:amino acid adenylation domain-containing protein [Burkholderia ubonensis]|uniref:amino acid adenylation domain-containing protein n=1 Tax=Burkholderia ubonensis TaxID=101571 RepID=UPI0009B48787|nr:amino acid adenylation domain-containing protein [Burkholderia ubonensis]